MPTDDLKRTVPRKVTPAPELTADNGKGARANDESSADPNRTAAQSPGRDPVPEAAPAEQRTAAPRVW